MPQERTYDLAIIGGGINGAGIARDAAGRGHSVVLFEQNDLASGTSSWSTKLIHGGLRYLEHYEFRLVREALTEREVLMGVAPHLVRPIRFVLPHHAGLRPAWLLRLGLFLYDHIGGRKRLPATRTLDLGTDEAGAPLTPGHRKAFEYSDCTVDDTRLVVMNARDAADRGAMIHPRTRVIAAHRDGDAWRIETTGGYGEAVHYRASALINAAGPWVEKVLSGALGANAPAKVRLVQGSHIVVRRLFDHDRAYIFQNADGRIVFAIPYHGDFTLIGTTDRDYTGDPAAVTATPDEIAYLCEAVRPYFRKPVRPEDVVWAFSGVRPLYDDGASAAQEATRDYVLVRDPASGPALLSVFGGKITTYRRLAEEVLEKLEGALPARSGMSPGWTGKVALPGGDLGGMDLPAYAADFARRHPFLAPDQALRLARAYGSLADTILGDARATADLGHDYGAGLSARELDWLVRREWATRAEDVLWRRSKLGLVMNEAQRAALSDVLPG